MASGAAAAGMGAGFSNSALWAMALGSAAGNAYAGVASTKKQKHYQADLMQMQQAWLEKMSNTAHQREVEDLRKAGLNPILSATGGQGASTPSAGMGQINTPNYGSISEAISTAMQAKQANASANLMDEEAKTEATKRENFEADSVLKRALGFIQEVKAKYADERERKELDNIEKEMILKTVQATATQADAITNRMNAETNRMVGKEQAKYTKERSRGYTESWTDSTGKDIKLPLGTGGAGSNRSTSYSRTY